MFYETDHSPDSGAGGKGPANSVAPFPRHGSARSHLRDLYRGARVLQAAGIGFSELSREAVAPGLEEVAGEKV